MSEPHDNAAETQLQLGLPARANPGQARARAPSEVSAGASIPTPVPPVATPVPPVQRPLLSSAQPVLIAPPPAAPVPTLAPVPQHADAIRAVAQGHRGRVVVQDAFELLAQLPDESVDLLVTDPPYQSLELHRSRGTTTRLTTDWFSTIPDEKLPELLAQAFRVLRPDRHFYLFCDEVTADVIKRQQNIGGERMSNGGRRCASGLIYWKELVWAKTTLDGAKIRGGTGYHYRASCERILFFEKGKRALSDLGIPDVLMAPRPQVAGPAVKPAALVRTLISQSSREGELVVDPFCGSGVVGVEARALGRRFLLGDIDLAYLDPSLADAAPPGLPRSPGLLPEEGTLALAPPALEELFKLAASDAALHAVAEAVGWLDGDSATPELDRLLAIREREREAATRRALRSLPPGAPVHAAMHGGEAALSLLQQWRAWALGRAR